MPDTLDQQMQAYQATKNDSHLSDMAMTGVAAGLGAGVLSHLVSSWREKRKPKSPYNPLYPDAQTSIPFVSKTAILGDNPVTDGMTTDPLHGLKLVGAMGLPALGTYLAARGVGNLWKKQRRKDDVDAVQGDYQKALNDYAATASGLKLAGEKTALDKLAEAKTANFFDLPDGPAKDLSNFGVGAIGGGGVVHGVGSLYRRMKKKKKPPAVDIDIDKTASPHAFNGFGLFGQGNPVGDTATAALGVGIPLAALYGYHQLRKGMKAQKAVVDDAKDVRDRATTDWRRKELFYRPPPISAVPYSIPAQG